MYKGKKVIVCSPVGRKESMKCLFKQVLKHRHVVDEHHLWVNTIVEEDLDYINQYAEEYKDFVVLKYGCEELDPNQMGRAHNVKRFYNYCVEKDTFYFKVDDDIIFIEENLFEKLSEYKLDNPETFLVYPVIINNSWCTHFLRKFDAIDVPEDTFFTKTWYPDFEESKDKIKTSSAVMSDNIDEPKLRDFIPEDRLLSQLYWYNSQFAYAMLDNTYQYIKENKLSLLDIPSFNLNYEPVSINFIMWSGEDFSQFNGDVKSLDDEPWLSTFYPLQKGIKNAIVGDVRAVHYAYWTQRDYLNTTDILNKYENL